MATSATWGSSPAISLSVIFNTGNVVISVGAISGGSYFGYPIYVDLYNNSTCVLSGYQIKSLSTSQWEAFSRTLIYSGVTRVRFWSSGSGLTRGAINLYKTGSVVSEGSTSSGGTTEDDTGGGSTGSGSGGSSGSAGSTITEASFGLSCGNIVLGGANTLTVTRPSASYTPTFSFSFGNVSESISPTLVSSTSTKLVYSWTPSETLAQQIPNSATGSGTITMKIGGYTKQYSFVAVVPDTMVPTAALAVDVVNDNSGVSVCARGLSKLHYAVTAAGVYGSTITGYEFVFAGQTLTGRDGTTGLIGASGRLTPIVTVTDSRGRRATVEAEAITVYDYSNPVIRSSFAVRRDVDGKESEDGAYLYAQCTAECSDLNGTNTLTVQARYKATDGSYGGYVTIPNGGIETQIGSGLVADKSYTVEIVATDTVGNSRVVEHTSFGSSVAFHLKRGGNGAAFGKYSETDDCFDCLWDAKFHGNVEVDGEFTIDGKKPLFAGNTLHDMNLLDLVYPVGAVYISASNVNPATLFGGTWTAIEGKFLLGADTAHAAGSEGGTEYRNLETHHLPSHSHTPTVSVGYDTHWHGIDDVGTGTSGGSGVYVESWGSGSNARGVTTDSYSHKHDVSVSIGSTGDGQSFSIMPPYLAVYMWKRTA